MNQTMQIEHPLEVTEAAQSPSTARRHALAGAILTAVGFSAASCAVGGTLLVGLLAIGYAGHLLPEIRPLAFAWTVAGMYLAGAASAATLRRGRWVCLCFGLGFLLAGLLFPAALLLTDAVVPARLHSAVRILAVIVPACALTCSVAGTVGSAPLFRSWSAILFATVCFGLVGAVGGAVAMVPCIFEMGELAMIGGLAAGLAISIFCIGLCSAAISYRHPA